METLLYVGLTSGLHNYRTAKREKCWLLEPRHTRDSHISGESLQRCHRPDRKSRLSKDTYWRVNILNLLLFIEAWVKLCVATKAAYLSLRFSCLYLWPQIKQSHSNEPPGCPASPSTLQGRQAGSVCEHRYWCFTHHAALRNDLNVQTCKCRGREENSQVCGPFTEQRRWNFGKLASHLWNQRLQDVMRMSHIKSSSRSNLFFKKILFFYPSERFKERLASCWHLLHRSFGTWYI